VNGVWTYSMDMVHTGLQACFANLKADVKAKFGAELTTVYIHTQIMACEAARLLLSRIREPSLDYRTVYTETYLIERESTLGSEKEPQAT